MKKKIIFACTVKLLLSASLLQAQTMHDSVKQNAIIFSPGNAYFNKQLAFQNIIAGNFYAKQLPFFCSKELQVQKTTGFPIKFRLGSVEYCDKLEGKNTSYHPAINRQ